MKLKIYSIKDTKIGFMSPMYLQNDSVAIREFSNAAASTAENIVNKNPEDKELWIIGEFDDETGIISPVELRCLGRAIDFIKVGE